LLTMALLYRLIRFTVVNARATHDPFWMTMASIVFALPVTGVFCVELNTPCMLLLTVWMVSPPARVGNVGLTGQYAIG